MENEKKYPIKFPEEMPFKEKKLFPGVVEGFNSYEFKDLNGQNLENLGNNIYISDNCNNQLLIN